MTEGEAREELAGLCLELTRLGLVGPLASGNASLRFDDGLLVTPSGVSFAETAAADLVAVPLVAGPGAPDRRATTELSLHRAILAVAPAEVRVVAHLHSPWLVAASCLALHELPVLHYHQALLGSKPTPVVGYATPGSDALANAAAAALEADARALVLGNHGGVVVGATAPEVLARAEVLEDACRLTVLTGERRRVLTGVDLAAARALFETYPR